LDGEAKMITNGRTRSAEPSVAASLSGMTRDAIELAELQAQLFAYDVKSSGERARSSLMLAIVGVCLLLSAFPILLMALAVLLNTLIEWPPAVGYAIAGVVGLLASGAVFAVAYAQFKRGILTLDRSREELSRNIAWLKTQLSRTRNTSQRIPNF
jgi:uncharacterized membrane protein YqjE